MVVENLFRKVRDALELAGIPYMVTGLFVSAVHGVPRVTHDIDIVIAPTAQQLDRLVKHFEDLRLLRRDRGCITGPAAPNGVQRH